MQTCWRVPTELTREVSEPLAAILDRYLPEPAKRMAEVGLDPIAVVGGLYMICQHCAANEKAAVEQYIAAQRQDREHRRIREEEPHIADQEPLPDDPAAMVERMMDPNKVLVES